MVKAASTNKTDLSEAAGGNIGQIREIIFGEQIRDYEQRFKALEQSITKAAGDLTTRLEDQVAGMQASLEKQAKLSQEDLGRRSEQGAAELAAAEARVDQVLQKLNTSLAELDEFAVKETRNLGTSLDSQMTELRALMDSVAEEVHGRSEEQVAALRRDSVDRKALGELLHRLADEIGGK